MTLYMERINDYQRMKTIRKEINLIKEKEQSPKTIQAIQKLEAEWKGLKMKYFEVYETSHS